MGYYQFFVILICYLYLILLNAFTADAAVEYDGPESVPEGEPFTVTCVVPRFSYRKWRLNNTFYNFGGKSNTTCPDEYKCTSNVTISYASSSHTGIYKCSYESDDFGHNVTVVTGTTYSLTVNFTEQNYQPCQSSLKDSNQGVSLVNPGTPPSNIQCIAGRPYEKFRMQCYPNAKLMSNVTLAWYRATDPAKQQFVLIENDGRVQPNKGELFFKGLLQNDTNRYHCRAVQIGDERDQKFSHYGISIIDLQVLPFIKKMPKDVTAIEENMINLTCTVISNVSTTVIWKLDTLGINKTYYQSEDRITLIDVDGTKNSILSIKSANQSLDRGNYTCFANSSFGPSVNNATLYVRVKGKYAALIPFLGICAEVIILCLIILIYEKKRDKTELEESDTDQGPETKNSPDHGQDSVRYRK